MTVGLKTLGKGIWKLSVLYTKKAIGNFNYPIPFVVRCIWLIQLGKHLTGSIYFHLLMWSFYDSVLLIVTMNTGILKPKVYSMFVIGFDSLLPIVL